MSKKFVDPKNAVKFRMAYRSENDPAYKDTTDRVFQLIEDQSVLLIYQIKKGKDYDKTKDAIINQFNKEDLGVYDAEKLPKKAKSRVVMGTEVMQKLVHSENKVEEDSCEEVSDGESWGDEEEEEE